MTKRKLGNLYFSQQVYKQDIWCAVNLTTVTSEDILVHGEVLKTILNTGINQSKKEINKEELMSISIDYKSFLFSALKKKKYNKSEILEMINEFTSFIEALTLNSKIHFRNKTYMYTEFINNKDIFLDDDGEEEKNAFENEFIINILFFSATFLLLSKNQATESPKTLMGIDNVYFSSCDISEFMSYIKK